MNLFKKFVIGAVAVGGLLMATTTANAGGFLFDPFGFRAQIRANRLNRINNLRVAQLRAQQLRAQQIRALRSRRVVRIVEVPELRFVERTRRVVVRDCRTGRLRVLSLTNSEIARLKASRRFSVR